MRTNPITNPRAKHRNIAAWVERQTHDEFELMAKARGISKGEYMRELIKREVEANLSVSALRIPHLENGNAEASTRTAS